MDIFYFFYCTIECAICLYAGIAIFQNIGFHQTGGVSLQPIAAILTDGYPQDTAFLQSLRQTVCFSGHRPDAFPQGTIVDFPMVDVLKTLLAGCIELALQDGFRYFLDGLAEGVDLWAAEYLLYRKQHSDLPMHLIAVEPCLHYLENRRSGKAEMMRYVEQADALVTIPMQGKYSFLRRNDYMIAHSWRLICMICKPEGGTAYTLKQAVKGRKEIHCMDVRDQNLLFQFAMQFLTEEQEIPHTAAERYRYYQQYPETLSVCRTLLKSYAKW